MKWCHKKGRKIRPVPRSERMLRWKKVNAKDIDRKMEGKKKNKEANISPLRNDSDLYVSERHLQRDREMIQPD